MATPMWDARIFEPGTGKRHPMEHSAGYYARCVVGGALSCGLTHTGVVPLDVAKCRMQVFPEKYSGLRNALRSIVREEGTAALTLGWSPTLIGYAAQGMFKFGFYELFKDTYGNILGERRASEYRGTMWLAASASAEILADIALCPLEMIKVKIQTSFPGSFPSSIIPAAGQMLAMRHESRFPFGSLVPLWSRQIPYTMAKFFFFEKVVQLFYDHIFTKPKNSYGKETQLGITFASGYLAGVICAIVSHPADSIVSQLGKVENKDKGFGQIIKDVGYWNLFTRGLGTRVLMIGTLTGLQWWIYDTFKTVMGMGTTGSGSTNHPIKG